MRIDLHCHSKFSKRPTLWLMQKLGCPESFTEPLDMHRLLRERGMDAVTITDHNVIDGALEIAHLPNTFLGCEYTTYFPEDRCKVHVLAYGFTEQQHADMTRARENIFDFARYLHEEGIWHVCAHPLFGPNDRITVAHVEQLALLFKTWEWNGDQVPVMNETVQRIVSSLTQRDIDRLAERHGVTPLAKDVWKKNLTGGSDDHSSLHLACTYTEVADADSLEAFWMGVNHGLARVRGTDATPQAFARNVYGIAYQFYKSQLGLGRHVQRDVFLNFLDRTLQTRCESTDLRLSRVQKYFSRRRRDKRWAEANKSFFQLARMEAEKILDQDPQLVAIVRDGTSASDMDHTWFQFVDRVANKALMHFGEHLLDRVLNARLIDMFHSLGSAGAVYGLLAPYLVAYSHHAEQEAFTAEAARAFLPQAPSSESDRTPHVAHFTDTLHEVNGVARTLLEQLETAIATGKKYTIVTCFSERQPFQRGVHQFNPVGQFTVPEYPELKLLMPPLLQMLQHCHEEKFTHIHIATPGPVGLAGLVIARILKLPVAGTYHTAVPQYAKILTEDAYVEELAWKFMIWFYDQLDAIYVPSEATAAELIERGINRERVKAYPRGIDIDRFHPSKRGDIYSTRFHLDDSMPRLLYVGRVSREKNLHHLALAYRKLLASGLEARLVIVGDGPFRAEMESMLAGTPALFTGYVEGEDLAQIYASSDLFVFPSATDTFGNVVLEAQAAGIPVIVTNQGGPQENLVAGHTGLVVQAGDIAELAEAMASLVADPARRLAMGHAARGYMDGRGFHESFCALFDMLVGSAAAHETSARARTLMRAWINPQTLAS